MTKTVKIYKIQQIQNLYQWQQYSAKKEILEKFYGKKVLRKLLFHGTSSTDPSEIYKDDIGFDIKFARNGHHGLGLYFHERFEYSNGYAFETQGFKQIFLAEVIIGECEISPDKNTNKTPSKIDKNAITSQNNQLNKKYDSICDGDQMYVVYETSRAYPHWVITYSYS